jgi:hypothetical protein
MVSPKPTRRIATGHRMALVKPASLVETRWHADTADCASRRATLERTSAPLFIFSRSIFDPHMKDYAMAAVNGTLARRRDAHFVRTIGIDHKQAIAGEGFRVLAGGVVENHSGLQL